MRDVCRSHGVGGYQTHAYGEAHQPRHVVDAQPLHQLAAVGFHGLDAQVQAAGDLGVP